MLEETAEGLVSAVGVGFVACGGLVGVWVPNG